MSNVIAYYRVSTDRQRRSGLGIEAQRTAVHRFAEAEGLEVLSEYVETETGKGADALDRRPQLAAALGSAPCQVSGGGRQARSPVARRGLRGGPYGPTGAVHRRGARSRRRSLHAPPLRGARRERARLIAERTRLALGAKKATGARLGNPRNLNEAGALGRRTLASEADRPAANVLPIVQELRAAGLKALGAIAAALNSRGVRTARAGVGTSRPFGTSSGAQGEPAVAPIPDASLSHHPRLSHFAGVQPLGQRDQTLRR